MILTPLPQADGQIKTRPALLLRRLPPFGDFLVCGISTQTKLAVTGFDDVIRPGDPDFLDSGLIGESVIRLGYPRGSAHPQDRGQHRLDQLLTTRVSAESPQ